MERLLESAIFSSRWLMAPFYVGLIVALGILLFKFLHELVVFIPQTPSLSEAQVILGVLTLVDLSLAANLLLIVIFSGYENFVSKIHVEKIEDRPEWMGTVDFSGLKLKLVASMVAISGIHLLKKFMDIKSVSKEDLFWLIVVHAVFVVSGLLLALMDYISSRVAKKTAKGAGPA